MFVTEPKSPNSDHMSTSPAASGWNIPGLMENKADGFRLPQSCASVLGPAAIMLWPRPVEGTCRDVSVPARGKREEV